MSIYPIVKDVASVGNYSALVKTGGGYVWDEVLEYRVWCSPGNGAEDEENGDDYYYAFATYEEAQDFALQQPGAEEPLALILQKEYIDEPKAGKYIHVKKQRLTEWPVEFLSRPRRDGNTIPAFLSPNAPASRLDILRGINK